MYKHLYSRFLKENKGVHFACHSHHYWPDVTRQAMLDYWDDSSRLVDQKWDYFFSEKIPETQKLIANELKLSDPESLVFAPNTHELLYRLVSSLYSKNPVKILCSDSEFHSFKRQSYRWQEVGMVELTEVPCEPFETFEQRFIEYTQKEKYELVFCSQVFFDSGKAINNLNSFVDALAQSKATIVIDGYHAFMALPTDLSSTEDKTFYLAGSYKYAQGGEGACFMHVPKNCQLRPVNTGWFADFTHIEDSLQKVSFAPKAQAFAGATTDMSAIYRLSASLSLFKSLAMSAIDIHDYVVNLQKQFLDEMDRNPNQYINRQTLLNSEEPRGHFLVFEQESVVTASKLQKYLSSKKLFTDCRGRSIRFGFALYHDPQDYDLSALNNIQLG